MSSAKRPELRVLPLVAESSVSLRFGEHLGLRPRHLAILMWTRCSISSTDFVADSAALNLLNQGRRPLKRTKFGNSVRR